MKGIFTRRGLFRRAGTLLGAFALAVQCLVFAFHHPVQAAPSAAFPFQDPAAWCGALGTSSLPGQGDTKAPLHGIVCPICQSLQTMGTGLLPVSIALAAPVGVILPALPAADIAAPHRFSRLVASPRAPPALS